MKKLEILNDVGPTLCNQVDGVSVIHPNPVL